ncbi:MAG TPA: MFS transporter [Steroidobacteraceae bacterium]|nr:MFS transporter [Steroidobacteraceae bacterium]
MSTQPIANDTGSKAGNYRWVICALLFVCTTINYIDRNSLSVLKTTLQQELHWTDVDYGWITTAFTCAYAMFPSLIGFFVDRFGVKKALAGALVLWSAAAAAHGLVGTVIGFMIVRFVLGLAEAANFPASIKAVAMWFPQKERALATGLFNSGTSVGVIVSGVVVWIATQTSWQMAFLAIGLLGLFWLVFWQKYFDAPERVARVGQAELDYIKAGIPKATESVKVPWPVLLRRREIWPFLIGKFITDPVWWFYLFWLPDYLARERGLDALKAGFWVGVIYVGSSIGSILGGWLSGNLIKRGWTVGKARMLTMALAAVFMPSSILAYYADSFVACVAFISLATACHQAWSANLFTNATDLFPQKVSGSVVGLGATAGGFGGMLMTLLVGLAVQWTGNQQIAFILAGVMHVSSLALFWFWFRARFVQVDIDAPFDTGAVHRGLIIGGITVLGIAAWLLYLVSNRWEYIESIVKFSGALQAAIAAGGFGLIGLALIYAALPRRSQPLS